MSRWTTQVLAEAMIARNKTVRYAPAKGEASTEDAALCKGGDQAAHAGVSAPVSEASASVAQPKSRKRGAK